MSASPAPRHALTAQSTMQVVRAAPEPHIRAAAALALARALRSRGLVEEQSAGADGIARILVITPTGAQLAKRVYAFAHDCTLWFWWSGEPLCPTDDIGAAADKIAHMLAPQSDPGVMQIRGRPGA